MFQKLGRAVLRRDAAKRGAADRPRARAPSQATVRTRPQPRARAQRATAPGSALVARRARARPVPVTSLGPGAARPWARAAARSAPAGGPPRRHDLRGREWVARSPRGGAVCRRRYIYIYIYYTSYFVSDEEKAWFSARGDQQIAGLELLAIALAFSTWEGASRRAAHRALPCSLRIRARAGLLQDRAIAVWSDNVVAEGSVRKGSARAWDHTCIVHAL